MYFRLLPESEWSEAEKTYKTLEFGNQDLGTVILGHSFANAESARQLYRLLTYLDSDTSIYRHDPFFKNFSILYHGDTFVCRA